MTTPKKHMRQQPLAHTFIGVAVVAQVAGVESTHIADLVVRSLTIAGVNLVRIYTQCLHLGVADDNNEA